MALTLFKRQRPFEGLTTWYDDFEKFFDESFTTENLRNTWTPAVDIEHKEKEYVLKADLPGVKKEDIKVLSKYLDIWNPMRFVTFDEAKKIIKENK